MKIRKIKRIAASLLASVCALSSMAAITANAASKTVTGTMSNGYTVSSTASYSGKTATGTGKVTNGSTCSISTYIYAYRLSGSSAISAGYAYNYESNNTSCSATYSGSYTLCGAKCVSTFNSSKTVTAKVGTCA